MGDRYCGEEEIKMGRKYSLMEAMGIFFLSGAVAGWLAMFLTAPAQVHIVSWHVVRRTVRDEAKGGRFVDLYRTKNHRYAIRAAVHGNQLYEMIAVEPWMESMVDHELKRNNPLKSKPISNQEYAELQRDKYVDQYVETNSKKKK